MFMPFLSHGLCTNEVEDIIVFLSEAVVDLGFLEGGFRFRWTTAIAHVVTSCQARAAEAL